MQEIVKSSMPSLDECCNQLLSMCGSPFYNSILGERDPEGNVWMPMGSMPWANAYNRFFHTIYFYRVARWQSDFLYFANPYATACIDSLVNSVVGSGFTYQCETDEEQEKLAEFIQKSKWKKRSREAAIRTMKSGECFLRKFGDDDMRFVEPDLVFDSEHMGIETEEDDYETIKRYWINEQPVEPDQIQHRKLALSGEKRGVSILFSISSHLQAAEQLLHNLTRTADQQSRIAWIVEHEANQASVKEYEASIRNQLAPGERWAGTIGGKYTEIEAGATIHTNKGSTWQFPGAALDASKYIEVLHAVLRLCASRVGIPETVLTNMDEMGAYNSSIIASNHATRGMTVLQEQFAEWDLDLFEMFGFDRSRIKVIAPEIPKHDVNQTVAAVNCLKTNNLASDSTLAKMFDVNYEHEKTIMAKERPEQPANGNGESSLPTSEPSSIDTKQDKPEENEAS